MEIVNGRTVRFSPERGKRGRGQGHVIAPVRHILSACRPEDIAPEVLPKLNHLYPKHLATGYNLVHLRGAASNRIPLQPARR